MSTEEERLAKKRLELEKLTAKSDKLTKELYHTIEMKIETDEQKELFKVFKALDRRIDRLENNFWDKLDALHEERERVFEELSDSFE